MSENKGKNNIESEFQKKDMLYSSTMGLCVVSDITKLSADKNTPPVPYYVLKSYYDKSHVAYIPVEGHEVELRYPIDRETAEEALERLKAEYANDADYTPDVSLIGEVAYVLGCKPEELRERAGARESII